jgi:hypothetical protein
VCDPLFFVEGDLQILKPHLKAALANPVTLPPFGVTEMVQPPTTALNWTVAPRIEAGYFIPGGLGLFAASYRFLISDGNATAIAQDGTPFGLRSRLDVNQFAFDYGTLPWAFAPRWDVSGRLGIGLADVFFDNLAVSDLRTFRAADNFLGAGPHVRGDLRHHFGLLPGLDLMARADLLVLVGQSRQRFTDHAVNFDGSTSEVSIMQKFTDTVPVLTVQAGLTYTPPGLNNWHFSTGYQFEEWWFIGKIEGHSPREQFYTNGLFLRTAVEF